VNTDTPKLKPVRAGDRLLELFWRTKPELTQWLSNCRPGSYLRVAETEDGTSRVVVASPWELHQSLQAGLETILTNHGLGSPLYITDREIRDDGADNGWLIAI
jgi:hypothetical protein